MRALCSLWLKFFLILPQRAQKTQSAYILVISLTRWLFMQQRRFNHSKDSVQLLFDK